MLKQASDDIVSIRVVNQDTRYEHYTMTICIFWLVQAKEVTDEKGTERESLR